MSVESSVDNINRKHGQTSAGAFQNLGRNSSQRIRVLAKSRSLSIMASTFSNLLSSFSSRCKRDSRPNNRIDES